MPEISGVSRYLVTECVYGNGLLLHLDLGIECMLVHDKGPHRQGWGSGFGDFLPARSGSGTLFILDSTCNNGFIKMFSFSSKKCGSDRTLSGVNIPIKLIAIEQWHLIYICIRKSPVSEIEYFKYFLKHLEREIRLL